MQIQKGAVRLVTLTKLSEMQVLLTNYKIFGKREKIPKMFP